MKLAGIPLIGVSVSTDGSSRAFSSEISMAGISIGSSLGVSFISADSSAFSGVSGKCQHHHTGS